MKIGDKVKIKSRINTGIEFGISVSMLKVGDIGKITSISDTDVQLDSKIFRYHLTDLELVNDERHPNKLTRKQLSEIYEHSCNLYKEKINILLLSNDNKFSDVFEVTIEEVKQAYKDATNEDHLCWLETYLPLPKSKPIKIVRCLQSTGNILDTSDSKNILSKYKDFNLISKNYGGGKYDVFSAKFSDSVNDLAIFLGHWNDGVIESKIQTL